MIFFLQWSTKGNTVFKKKKIPDCYFQKMKAYSSDQAPKSLTRSTIKILYTDL